jgi:hypothetical protein
MLTAEIFHHCLLVATIIVSRKLVSMGRKFCLFVCYVEHIGTELWMAEEVVALNGSLHSRTVEGKIRKRIREQCRQVFLFSSSVSGDGKLGLLRLVFVISDFHCISDYTMVSNMYLLGISSIKGDKKKEVRAIEKGACRKMSMHFEWDLC